MNKHLTSSEQRLFATKQLGKLEFAHSNIKAFADELFDEDSLDYGETFDKNIFAALNNLEDAINILKNHIDTKIGYGLN